ncbi:MAG: glycosyltransferase family 4 protein, partial [Phycisphaerales bacterium]|nr:glycosyltransferase family 4 protein [Phycisphaerales bacterium]
RSEGLSMALLEQMMAGLAIVATDVGDTSRAIEHERTGLLVPPGDDAALGDALARVVGDVGLRRRLGAAARERALGEFSLDAMATQAIDAYQKAGAIL